MASLLINFLILLIIVVGVAAIVLWAVQKFFPAIYEPARYVVGGIALIVILLKLAPIVQRAL